MLQLNRTLQTPTAPVWNALHLVSTKKISLLMGRSLAIALLQFAQLSATDLGFKEDELDGYLGHFMWERFAKEYKKDLYIFFLECIAEISPPPYATFEGVGVV